MLTPHGVHYGLAEWRHANRALVLHAAYAAHADQIGNNGADPFLGKGRINVVATVNDPTP